MTPANDNGPMGADWGAVSLEFASFISNTLRVMRGGGRPERVANYTAYFGRLLAEQPRHLAVESLLNGAYRWHDVRVEEFSEIPRDGEDNRQRAIGISHAEFELCSASLRLIASQLDGNSTELSKSRSDVMTAVECYRRAFTWRDIEQPEVPNISAYHAGTEPDACYVYFIHSGDAIKIGKSINPEKRLASLQTSHHRPLRLLATMKGGVAEESGLHARFGQIRLSGEWFEDAPELRAYIAGLSQTPVPWPENEERMAA